MENSPETPKLPALQFQVAEHAGPETQPCAVCKMPIGAVYYQAAGANVCPSCADKIQAGQQAPPAHSMLKAFVYGSAAAFAGFLLYSLIAVFTGLEIGLIAIVVGIMVGTMVRRGSNGLGGRPQQILAVFLTYFAITTSYVATYVYEISKAGPKTEQSQSESKKNEPETYAQPMSAGVLAGTLLLITLAAPFLSLAEGDFSSIISLFIIFIGLSRAWRLTGRTDHLVVGPFEWTPSQ